MENSRSIIFFDSLRGTKLTEADIYELFKKFTHDSDHIYLKHFDKDLDLYLKDQKENIVDNLSEDSINAEINKRKLKQLPTLTIGALSGISFTNEEKIKEKKKIKYENRIDLESLMFPEEFSSLYILRNILKETLTQKELEQSNRINNPSVDLIDFSNSSGSEKIIMLEKLGVLDYLRQKEPFTYSINKLASVVSHFTGMKAGTVQPYLNSMFSKKTDQKNNPMRSKKTVNEILTKLSNLGFKLSK